MTKKCGKCANSRKIAIGAVFCSLFGITIRAEHENCRYWSEVTNEQIREPEDRSQRDSV